MVEGMITRAQAEALLTLAESLEACERLGVDIQVPGRDHVIVLVALLGDCLDLSEFDQLSGKAVRNYVSERIA